MPNKKQIAKIISERAIEKEITGYALAKATGIDTGTINRILSGNREPGAVTFIKICKALDIEIKDISDN